MTPLIFALLLTLTTPAVPPDCPPAPARAVEGGVLVSRADPAVRIRVDPALKYIGAFRFPLKGIACVERHVFAEAAEGRIRRLFIVQFESILRGSGEIYRWRIRNPRSLGGVTYQHNVRFVDTAAEIREEPESEPARTKAYLASKGLGIDDEVMTSRFARVVGAERKHELLFFYTEPLASIGWKLAEIEAAPEAERQELERALTRRSRQAFSLEP